MDPFAPIDDEVGQPSESQEERLLHSNFINDSPEPHSLPPADAPSSSRRPRGVQIRSSAYPGGTPPDGDREVGFGDRGAPSRRPDQEDGMRSENPQSDPNAQTSTTRNPDFAFEVVPGSRKLPASFRNPPPAEGREGFSSSTTGGRNSRPSIPREAASVADKPVLPGSLMDVIKMFSEKPKRNFADTDKPVLPGSLMDVIKMFSETPKRKFADTDILEILDMKGAGFLPPRWWRPEGYDN